MDRTGPNIIDNYSNIIKYFLIHVWHCDKCFLYMPYLITFHHLLTCEF